MEPTKFEIAIALIDKKNSEDINSYQSHGLDFPKELLYSQRMSQKLLRFKPNASRALQIASRAQHICRWKIARDEYPMDRVGYLKWRETLKKMHAEITAEILKDVGYDDEFIERVSFLINKKLIKKNEESQTIEDVICLVFLDYYFEEFAAKHEDEKVIDILQKTWKKMSEEGHAEALRIKFSDKSLALIKKAIS
jgi:predicted transcriptional regulator